MSGVLVALCGVALAAPSGAATRPIRWPGHGQAAYALDGGRVATHGRQRPAPIASVAKVMTARLVLLRFPLPPGRGRTFLRVSARDVADTSRRHANGESTVPVRAGERLTERQALQALLLPSANNIAVMLARRVSGSVRAFVRLMNRDAATLGMRRSHYTDPSGLKASTRSTASDQLRLVTAAMSLPAFRRLVATPSARIPVAGRVHNVDTLLGRHGFVGIKTGSTAAAGGCFVFRVRRHVHGRWHVVDGVVLGQRGPDIVQAGLRAADRLATSVLGGTS